MPLISIVTAVYNCEQYIAETILSVIDQTISDWELLLVDDASLDSSLEIIQTFARKDSRIKVIALDKNSGAATARNKGIEAATGRYIAFLDSDDMWVPEKLQVQTDVMNSQGAAVSCTAYFKMSENGEKTDRKIVPPDLINFKMLLCSNCIGCSTAVYDTNLVGKVYMPDIRRRQDYGLWLNILRLGHTAIGIRKPLAYYRIRTASLSRNKVKAAYYHWLVLRAGANLSWHKKIYYFMFYMLNGIRKNWI